jgi:hypothetical protein
MKRKSRLEGAEQDAVFVLSVIGAIDLVKELAIISEGLSDRPRTRDAAPTAAPTQERRNNVTTAEPKIWDSDFPV